jgi:hypothetical protein
VILGTAVALLALYTLFSGARPSGRVVLSDVKGAAEQLQISVPAKATGGTAKAGNAKTTSSTAPQAAPTAAPAQESTGISNPAAATTPIQPVVWGSDPFVRDWIMVNELANLALKAITVGGERAYALINDQILEEGDEISGKRIVKIEADKVTLEQGGRTFTLLLGE